MPRQPRKIAGGVTYLGQPPPTTGGFRPPVPVHLHHDATLMARLRPSPSATTDSTQRAESNSRSPESVPLITHDDMEQPKRKRRRRMPKPTDSRPSPAKDLGGSKSEMLDDSVDVALQLGSHLELTPRRSEIKESAVVTNRTSDDDVVAVAPSETRLQQRTAPESILKSERNGANNESAAVKSGSPTDESSNSFHEKGSSSNRKAVVISKPEPPKHDRFYFEDGDTLFEVGKTTYKLHQTSLRRYQPKKIMAFLKYERRMKTKREEPMKLVHVRKDAFDLFLSFLYSQPNKLPLKSQHEITIFIHFAEQENMTSVIDMVKTELENILTDPIQRISICEKLHLGYEPAFTALEQVAKRADDLSLHDMKFLTMSTVIKLTSVRRIYFGNTSTEGREKDPENEARLANVIAKSFNLDKDWYAKFVIGRYVKR